MTKIAILNPREKLSFVNTGNLILVKKPLKAIPRTLANACVKVLKLFGWLVPEVETKRDISYHSVTVDERKLLEDITTHSYTLIRYFGFSKLTVFMGPKQWCRLQEENTLFTYPVNFHSQFKTLRGMRVAVLPWLDGFVCVPDDYLEFS